MAGRAQIAAGVVARLAIILGVVLGAWGPDDIRGFFAHPVRAGLVAAGAAMGVVGLIFFSRIQPLRRGRKTVGAGALVAWVVFVFFVLAWLPYADRRGLLVFEDSTAVRALGLGLVAAGTALRLGALVTLGKQFSGLVTLQDDHELVQTGLYAWIRHPMYLGLLLAMTGVTLVFRSWLAGPVFLLSAVFVGMRISQEEKLLGERFGADFDGWRSRTWRLLPYVF